MKNTFVLRQFVMLLVSVILAGLVAAGEYFGRPISFTIFYLIAIFVCVHNAGTWPGIVLAAICGGLSLYIDLQYNPIYQAHEEGLGAIRDQALRDRLFVDRFIGYWNGFARTGVFVIFAVLISSVEAALKRERKINKNLETLMTLSPADPGGWLSGSGSHAAASSAVTDSSHEHLTPDPPSSDEPARPPAAS